MSGNGITVFLVDDHQAIVEGLMALAGQDPCIRVVGQCNNGTEAPCRVQAVRPTVLVLDISLPGLNGLDVCRLVKEAVPATAVLMLTMYASEQCVLGAVRNGAVGYVTKDSAAVEFCPAVHAVSRGGVYFGQGIPPNMMERLRGEPGVARACETGAA